MVVSLLFNGQWISSLHMGSPAFAAQSKQHRRTHKRAKTAQPKTPPSRVFLAEPSVLHGSPAPLGTCPKGVAYFKTPRSPTAPLCTFINSVTGRGGLENLAAHSTPQSFLWGARFLSFFVGAAKAAFCCVFNIDNNLIS